MYYSNWNNYNSYIGDTKYCSLCGKEFTKKKDESKKRWANRFYCSIMCYRKSRTPYIDSKICPQCNNEFNRSTKRSYEEWDDAIYCSKKCAKSAKAFVPQTKTCDHCNKTFDKKRKESHYDWNKKKFCSLICRKESDKKLWNDKEIEILKKYYEIGASQASLLLPGRSMNCINKKANELGLKKNEPIEEEFEEFDFTHHSSYDMWD